MTETRLKWMKSAAGFIAYPEGPTLTSRNAEIHFDITKPKGSQWHWMVHYDGAAGNGWVADKQRASDEANEAWPRVRATAKEVAAAKKARDELTAMVDRQALFGDVPLDDFAIATSSSDRLRSIIQIADKHFHRFLIPPNLQPLMEACSAELYRRRIAGS